MGNCRRKKQQNSHLIKVYYDDSIYIISLSYSYYIGENVKILSYVKIVQEVSLYRVVMIYLSWIRFLIGFFTCQTDQIELWLFKSPWTCTIPVIYKYLILNQLFKHSFFHPYNSKIIYKRKKSNLPQIFRENR